MNFKNNHTYLLHRLVPSNLNERKSRIVNLIQIYILTGEFMRKEFKSLSFHDDVMFFMITKNPDICKGFIEMFIGKEIERIVHIENKDFKEGSLYKNVTSLYVYFKGEPDLEIVDLFTSNFINAPIFTRHYFAYLDKCNIKSAEYEEDLLTRHFIIFNDKDPYGKGDLVYDFKTTSTIGNLEFNDGLNFYMVNLAGKPDFTSSTDIRNFVDYIQNGNINDVFTSKLDYEITRIRNNNYFEKIYNLASENLLSLGMKDEPVNDAHLTQIEIYKIRTHLHRLINNVKKLQNDGISFYEALTRLTDAGETDYVRHDVEMAFKKVSCFKVSHQGWLWEYVSDRLNNLIYF